jgi:hypothetical protein
MASPVKNLVDATGISNMATHKKVNRQSTIRQVKKQKRIFVAVQIQTLVSRFTLVRSCIKNKALLKRKIRILKETTKLPIFKTFPSGYHESSKHRPTEGLIFPRKRNKNY